MYTQYCKPAAVFPIKQRPLIRELESYPLSVFYLRASIKHCFFCLLVELSSGQINNYTTCHD